MKFGLYTEPNAIIVYCRTTQKDRESKSYIYINKYNKV